MKANLPWEHNESGKLVHKFYHFKFTSVNDLLLLLLLLFLLLLLLLLEMDIRRG